MEQRGKNAEGEGGRMNLLSNGDTAQELLGRGHEVIGFNELSHAETLPNSSQMVTKSTESTLDNIPFESTGISHSAAMSQMAILPEDVGIDEKVMPSGLSDINGQQLDLRKTNSWLLKMDQVSTPEIMEWCVCFAMIGIHTLIVCFLISHLKPVTTQHVR